MTTKDSLQKVHKTLATLHKKGASGCLTFTATDGRSIQFYVYRGQVAYACTKQHRARRLQRALSHEGVPVVAWANQTFRSPWEYFFLLGECHHGNMTVSQTRNIIYAVVREVLFALADWEQMSAQWQPGWVLETLVNREVSLSVHQMRSLFHSVRSLQQHWQMSGLKHLHADTAPQLVLSNSVNGESEQTMLSLQELFNGQRTFWDLMTIMQQSAESLSRMFNYYRKQQLVKLRSLPDYGAPQEQSASVSQQVWLSRPLVVCIDDSPQICREMEQMLHRLGYRCRCISDPIQALPILVQEQSEPVLLLIDLVMPVMNGYELCSHLRRVSQFTHTPIALMTGSKSIVDYVRAKMVGANELLIKPVEHQQLQQFLAQRLKLQSSSATTMTPQLGTLSLSLSLA